MIKLIENVGEAFEKSLKIIPLELKKDYTQQLIDVGYFAIDLGKYNSDSQISDLDYIIKSINKNQTNILVSVDNKDLYIRALQNSNIDFIETPFSILKEVNFNYIKKEKTIVPFYTNFNNIDELLILINQCNPINIKTIKLYNNNSNINNNKMELFLRLIKDKYPEIQLGMHLYLDKKDYKVIFNSVIEKSYFFETSIKSWSYNKIGCNLPTEKALTYLNSLKINTNLNILNLESAYNTAKKIFDES